MTDLDDYLMYQQLVMGDLTRFFGGLQTYLPMCSEVLMGIYKANPEYFDPNTISELYAGIFALREEAIHLYYEGHLKFWLDALREVILLGGLGDQEIYDAFMRAANLPTGEV